MGEAHTDNGGGITFNNGDPGITIRMHFASLAMQGICAASDEGGMLVAHGYEWTAAEAVKLADSLLVELCK